MAVGKSNAFRGQVVNVRCWYLPTLRVVTTDVTVAKIIGIDDDDVRFVVGQCAREINRKRNNGDGTCCQVLCIRHDELNSRIPGRVGKMSYWLSVCRILAIRFGRNAI